MSAVCARHSLGVDRPAPAGNGADRPRDKERIYWCIALGVLVVFLMATAAAAEDPRTPVKLPPDVRSAFMEEMRHHMDSLDDVIAALAAADFAAAAKAARTELAIGGGKGFGRFMPVEFREMGVAMHRAAADFADVAASVPAEPSGADWKKTMGALEDVSAQCRACHSAFRIE
jgi:cytochrome c556